MPKAQIESFWDAMWLGIKPVLCLIVKEKCKQLFPKIPEIAYTGKREHILKFIDSGNLHWETLWNSEKPIDKLDMMRYWINDPRMLLKENSQIFAYRFGYLDKL